MEVDKDGKVTRNGDKIWKEEDRSESQIQTVKEYMVLKETGWLIDVQWTGKTTVE